MIIVLVLSIILVIAVVGALHGKDFFSDDNGFFDK